MRLGTATQKLADAIDVPTAPVVLITALGSVVTSPASQATGLGIVATYSPITATFEATVSTQTAVTAQFVASFRTTPAITALFNTSIVYVAPVTASVTVGILTTVTQFVATTATVLTSTTFSYISTSTFSAPLQDSPNIFNFLNTKAVESSPPYRALTPLSLTAQMNTPIAAVFLCSFSSGSVSTISLVGEGAGYPNGLYPLTFSGGGATAGTVTAVAEVSTNNGKVQSITLTNGGSGYASAPTATLFTPAKSLSAISPTNSSGTVGGRSRFEWVLGRTAGDKAPIRFTNPDTTSIVTNTSVPSAFLQFVEGTTWEININNNGYGYSATPTVTHDDAPASTAKIKINRSGRGFALTVSTSGISYISNGGLPIIPNSSVAAQDTGIYGLAGLDYYVDMKKLSSQTTISLYKGNTADAIDERLFNFNETDYANKIFYGSITGSVIQNALIRASVPALTSGYNVITDDSSGTQNTKTQQGGGLFETEFEILDYGKSYTNPRLSVFTPIQPLSSLQSGQSIFQSPIDSVVTIPTVATNSFVATIISQSPTVATRSGRTATEYFIEDGGFGFSKSAIGTAFSGYQSTVVTQTTTAGGLIVSTSAGIVTTASLTAYPRAYISGTYDCQVQSPVSGTTAKIQLIVSSTTASVVIINGGSGYTSAPIVTAPLPNGRNGYVTLLSPLNNPSGYTAGVSVGLLFAPSAATGGTAEGEFALKTSRYIYASAIASVSETSYLTYEGVSTDPFGQLGVRTKYDPPISANAKITSKTNSKVVAKNTSGTQSISEYIVTYLDYRITNSGFGYTVAPTVLAQAPSKSTGGEIAEFILTNRPVGYNFSTNYDCSVATSPLDNGTAQLSFSLIEFDRTLITDSKGDTTVIMNPDPKEVQSKYSSFNQYDSTTIFNSFRAGSKSGSLLTKDKYIGITFNGGFGYTTSPTITAPTPDSTNVGQIIGLKLTNTPIGYKPNNEYQLTIGGSPQADGGASAKFSVSSLGVISTEIQAAGFGYTTKPTITAPSPNLDQGFLTGISVSTLGRGFAPGSYICNITDAPSGGETASVNFNVNNIGIGSFEVSRVGRGYITAPSISVPTPFGNIVKSITISCKGSYYEPHTALFTLNDSSGSSVSLGSPILSGGGIELIPVIFGGYGYSNTPAIQFSAPTEPIPNQLEKSFVEGDFNITTASANAILSTATQKDILMEVYETDGTNEQVVAQATVSLAKRVLE